MPHIIAFDLGSTMALAVTEGGALSKTFTGTRPEKLAQIQHWLDHAFQLAGGMVDAVIYERPFNRGQAATRMLWGIAGLIEAAAIRHGLPVVDVDPSTIKKWATGTSKGADKTAMTAAAQRLGYVGDNEHEADAYCLERFAAATMQFTDAPAKKGRK